MKKIAALLFLLVFAGLSVYFFFAEDYCHVHNPMPGGTFSHSHSQAVSICLCFWGNLFTPGSYDFTLVQDAERLPLNFYTLGPSKPFHSDISHPPKSFLV